MRTLIWRPNAIDQLDSLVGCIAERNKAAAERIEGLVHHATGIIERAPMAGRPGRVTGTRKWVVHPNYVLVDRVTRTQIVILRVLHARQTYP